MKGERAWRWTCPHCGGGSMPLKNGFNHLRRKHYDCWSCRIETLMISGMLDGRGYVFEGPLWPDMRHARQEDISSSG
jgi:hypothetical protein